MAVWNSLAVVDAEGLEARRKGQLIRRTFASPRPNDTWSCDGYVKLEMWGFPIHGCLDGFSRYLLWLRVGISNHDPPWILAYYLDVIEELSVMNLAGEGAFPGTRY